MGKWEEIHNSYLAVDLFANFMCQVSALFENGILVPRISFLSSTSDVLFHKSISNLGNVISENEMEILDLMTRTWSLGEKDGVANSCRTVHAWQTSVAFGKVNK